ncbi:MAG TPA: SDR family oxidoreductase [Candidatus Binataceae bacterium]|nr:SDR family oxidoreductase [Candidatus Binataceae bacterium]
MGRLSGKVAIITGAASGMGRATAVRFAGEGAKIVIADLNKDGGESAARDCRENGSDAVFQKTDVSGEADVKAAVDRAVKEFGRLDVIYNNAGLGGAVGPLENITVENWDKTMAILLRGVFLGIKHSIPAMRKVGGGSIISTASIAGIQGYAGIHPYSAAKAGVINLTRSAATELAKDKIRVNCICPGGINTPLIYGNVKGGADSAAQFLSKMQPMPREGRPDDIANMALFLASDESEWITGAAMVVDGGYTAAGNFFANEQGNGLQGALPSDGFAGPSFETRKS